MSCVRNRVLPCYRALIRTCQEVFKDEDVMLEAARRKIKIDFTQNKTQTDPEKIKELLKTALEADEVLRRLIVQGVCKCDGTCKLQFREDTVLEDNAPLPKR